MSDRPHDPGLVRDGLVSGGAVLGVGLGAVVDVALFHLALGWHHLLSGYYDPATEAGLRTNLRADGLFALAMLGVAVAGGAVVWRSTNRATRPRSPVALAGAVLVGAGLFNLFDGVVDHYVLGLHDAVHGTPAFNPHWIGASALLTGIGFLVVARRRR